MNNTRRIKTFIGAMTLAGAAAAIDAGYASHSLHLYLGLAVLALAAVTSRMKVKLPGVNGNMSVNLPFLLTAVVNLSAVEAVVISCVSIAVQCWPRKGAKPNPQQMTFNLSMMAFASGLASLIFHADWLRGLPWSSSTMGLVLATVTLFLGQTVPVAAIVAVSEGKSAAQIWANLAQLSFPYYVVSVGITSMVQTLSFHLGWSLALAVFPVMYGIHRSFQLYFGKMVETARPEVLVKAAGAGA
jgi:MASE9